MSGTNLMVIPGELQNQILEHCDALDRLALRGVCRRLRDIIPPPEVSDLVSFERTKVILCYNDLYACSSCRTYRHRSKFACAMLRSTRGRGGAEASSRFCVDCGIEKHTHVMDNCSTTTVTRYTPGEFVTSGGVRHVMCIQCREFGLGGREMVYPPTYTFMWVVYRGNGYSGPLRRPVPGEYQHYCKKCWEPIQKRNIDDQMEEEKQDRRWEEGVVRAVMRSAHGRSPSPVSGDEDIRDYISYY
ncbi:hypothetical protein PG988_000449 [Apiospora saccharicola]